MSSINYCSLFPNQQFLIGKEWPQIEHVCANYEFATEFYWVGLCLQHSVLHYWFPIYLVTRTLCEVLLILRTSCPLKVFQLAELLGSTCSNIWTSNKNEREAYLSCRNVYELNVSIRYKSYDFPISGVNRNKCGENIVSWLTESAEIVDALSTTRGPLLERHCVMPLLHITRFCKILKHSIFFLTPHNM